jgi:hypothetical protein
MMDCREKVKDIDFRIQHYPEFAKQLYYEKCPNKYMLEYIKRLNPNMAKAIQCDGRFQASTKKK